MKRFKKAMGTQLPATPCTAEMREQVMKIAQTEGRSMADIQRTAISIFLSSFASKIDGAVDFNSMGQAS